MCHLAGGIRVKTTVSLSGNTLVGNILAAMNPNWCYLKCTWFYMTLVPVSLGMNTYLIVLLH